MKKEQKLIPRKGAWVYIIKTTSIEGVHIPYMSVWYAIPNGELYLGDERRIHSDIQYQLGGGNYTYNTDMEYIKLCVKLYFKKNKDMTDKQRNVAKEVIENYEISQQVKLLTPFGSVIMQPEEYNVIDIDKYFTMLEDGSMQLKHMSTNAGLNNTLKERIFYIRSRGIPLIEAMRMIVGSLATQNAFFLLPNPAIQEMFLRDFDAENARYLAFKAKKVAENPANIAFFFDEEAALKLNMAYNGQAG